MASIKAIESSNILDCVQESEIHTKSDQNCRDFGYNLNDKAIKAKLVKGAKREALQIVNNTSSSNLVFNLGAWYNVVLPTVKYWNQVKSDLICKIGSVDVTIASVELGKDTAGKHVDTQVVFYANRD